MKGKRALGLTGILAALLVVAPAAAQQHQHQHQRGHEQQAGKMGMDTGWKELNGFHSLMHLSHQPLMQSGDVAPARRVAADLAAAAAALAKSPVPATCSGDDLAERTAKLAEQARAFAKLVADGADDDAVKAGVNEVHDLVEPIMKACRMKGG